MPISPYDAASLPQSAQALWVQALAFLPAQPVSESAIRAAFSLVQPVRLAYDGEPVAVIPGTVVSVSGSWQWEYPRGGDGPYSVVALAVCYGNPAVLVVGWAPLDAPVVLDAPKSVVLADLTLVVSRIEL